MTDFVSWDDVQANPDYQKLAPEKKEAARDSYFKQVVAPKVTPEKLTAARQSFDRYSMKSAPAEQKSLLERAGDVTSGGIVGMAGRAAAPLLETGLHNLTGAVSLPFQAAASLYGAATALDAPKGTHGITGAENATKYSQAVADAMTYQPRGEVAKGLTEVAGKVLGLPGELGEAAESAVQSKLENKGIPKTAKAAEITARMVPEVAAAVLGGRAGEAVKVRAATALSATRSATAAAATEALNTAKDFVTTKAGLKWEDVPPELQKKLRIAARDPKGLEKLDPETVQREVRAARLGMPISRGDAERNLGQQTREDTIKKVGDQNPVRDIRSAQDTALHGAVDEVRKSTGAEATTHEQIGESVQDAALRGKKTASKSAYDAAFDKARKTEPGASVSADPLYEALEHDPDIQHLGFLQTWLKKANIEREVEGEGTPAPPKGRKIQLNTDVSKAVKARDATAGKPTRGGGGDTTIERRPIPLSELQDLREKAAGIARTAQGSEKYFAGKLVKAIDRSFEKIPPAAKAWKEARSLYKAHQEEFEEQGIIKALGSNKRQSSDRRVPVENTVGKVLKSSKADIGTLKKTMTTGGTKATRAAGEKAWKNIQAGVLDELRKKAEGKRQIKGEKGQAQFGSPFLDMYNELKANGKIDAIFDAKQIAKLEEIAKGVADVRTKADKGISGSDTAANLRVENTLSGLEKAAKHTGGTYIAGALKLAKGIHESGRTQREFARAKTTPVTEAAENAREVRKKAAKARRGGSNTLKVARRLGPMAPLTLQNQSDQQR
jgi:hypothetical protein